MRLVEAAYVVADAVSPAIAGGAVAVEADRVRMVGAAEQLRRAFPAAERIVVGDAILMPGFVNAHQHGRGLSQIQLGYRDDALEPWIAARRRRGAPDTYSLTRLAALEMLANGVTSTLHANYSYGSGDYESELRGAIRAYEETGLRATVCVGFADRGSLVYPPEDPANFLARLSPEARQHLAASSKPTYLPSVDATIAMMGRLLQEYDEHPIISLAYGPAGPQWVSDEAWRALSADAAAKGLGLHFHLLESPAQLASARRLYPDGTLAHLERLGVFAARTSCAHFVHASADDISAAARLGLVVVTNPGSNMRLFNGAPPLIAFKDAGVTLALGTDNCSLADDEDYLRELRLGVLLARGSDTGGQKSDASSALEMATRAGAKAAFLENVGELRAGAQADLVAVGLERIRGAWLDPDMDVLDAVLSRGCGRDVVLTMVAGRVLYQHGAFPSADLAKAREEAAASASAARSAGAEAANAASELRSALRSHYSGGGQ